MSLEADDSADDRAAAALALGLPTLVWRRQIADTETPVSAALFTASINCCGVASGLSPIRLKYATLASAYGRASASRLASTSRLATRPCISARSSGYMMLTLSRSTIQSRISTVLRRFSSDSALCPA